MTAITSIDITLEIPTETGSSLDVPVRASHPLFIVGANGAGKSALVQKLSSQHAARAYKISGNRPVSLKANTTELRLSQRTDSENNLRGSLTDQNQLYSDEVGSTRNNLLLLKLITSNNNWHKETLEHCERTKEDIAAYRHKNPSPFERINSLLKRGALPIQLEVSETDEILARRDGGEPFGIRKLSDGQRNALLLAADVLTLPPGTIAFIDEPERHLHRSIMQPLLKALLDERQDCLFVVSTHEIGLPAAMPSATTLMIRGCRWSGAIPESWQVEVLPANLPLPEDLRFAVLGSRDTIIFIEGTGSSLDAGIYVLLFPGVTIQPQGSNKRVIQAVQGLRGSTPLHWVHAFGLVDRDDRTASDLDALRAQGIHATGCCAVEGLYYCKASIIALATAQAAQLNIEVEELIEAAVNAFIGEISRSDVKTELVQRRCEKRIKEAIVTTSPKWDQISDAPVSVTVDTGFSDEQKNLHAVIASKDIDAIWARYAAHHTEALEKVARALRFKNRAAYEAALLTQLSKDVHFAQSLRAILGTLSSALTPALAFTSEKKSEAA